MSVTDHPRIQPHDLEAEQAILGAILLEPSALSCAQELLRPDDFYESRHQQIFRTMEELATRNEPVDLLTVGNLLETKGDLVRIGGRGVVAELVTAVGSASNIAHHCRIVVDHAKRRRLIKLAFTLSQGAYDNHPLDELLQELERDLTQVVTGRGDRGWVSLADVATDTVKYVNRVHTQTDALVGIPSGYAALDALLGGWQRSDLIIVAARPSMGKTALALGSALAAAIAGYRVGVLSMEMSCRQVGLRLHGMGAPIDVHALRTGSVTPQGWSLLAATAHQFESLPFWIDDSSVVTVEHVAAKARQLQAKCGLDLLVVDYLQLLQLHNAENRQQGIADASRKLKLLAKELDIPVVVLSQLSRAVEARNPPRPILADLRDSGAIEQDADVVLFIYREAVYNMETDEKDGAEILVRKHRNGPIGDRRLKFVDRFARFEDLDVATG